ncbi:30S ribosomal protein S27ae [Candidatus Woesearchaeota archaeon]|nr:30S ribosomal protein S27ae [Candidatus Woesearchaeota archaeon]
MAEKKSSGAMQVWKLYDSKAGLKRKNKTCPKCGQGVFLGEHNNRVSCGRCGYAEMKGK